MKTMTPCPDTKQLKDLLEDHLPASLQAQLTGHLDECGGCQQALEHLAAGDSGLNESLSHIDDDRPKSDSAYWPALAAIDSAPTVAQVKAPPALVTDPELDFLDPSENPGYLGRLSHYDVIRIAGRGGMGMVLHAFDTHLQRDVALKVLDPRVAKDEIAQERFCREARAAASVTHENVVAVHAVEHDEDGKDLPFLVMQLVDGDTLEVHLLREGRLDSREIVRIGMQMAAGLAAAHEKGLIHRDIKPGNVLLERGSDRVKLTDFGLARVKEDMRLTQSGMVAGTPLYMAPEQARGEEVDQRSDLFSLGVVLYEMAAGETPFLAKTPLAVLKRLTEEAPRPLHELNPELPQWLADVINRLLAKNPKDRFQTASEVAVIFEQHWAFLKTSAAVCPKVRAAARANRIRLAKMIGGGIVLATVSALFGAMLLPRFSRDNAAAPAIDSSPALRSVLKGNAGPVWAVGFTPKADQVAMAIDDGTVKLWDAAGANVLATLNAHKGPIWGMAISPDGSLLATGSDDTTAKIWDLATRKELFSLQHTGGVRSLAFDPSGKVLATGSRNGAVRFWNAATGEEILSTRGHAGIVTALAYAPDGKTLVTGSGDKTVKLWDTITGDERFSIDGHNGGVYAVAVSPQKGMIAAGGWDKIIRLYDISSGSLLAALESPAQDIWSLAFSPDGRWLASAHDDKFVMVWDVQTRKQTATLRGHTATVYAVAFSADGRLLASAGRDGVVRLWDAEKAVHK